MNKEPLVKVGGQRMNKNQVLSNALRANVNPGRVHPSSHLAVAKLTSDKTDRNGPCPCGSGKKFKKCCLDKGLPQRANFTSEGLYLEAMVNGGHMTMEQLKALQGVDPKDEWPWEDWLTAVKCCNGEAFPEKYDHALKCYWTNGVKPEDACRYIQADDVQQAENWRTLLTKLDDPKLDRIRRLGLEGLAIITGATDEPDKPTDGSGVQEQDSSSPQP